MLRMADPTENNVRIIRQPTLTQREATYNNKYIAWVFAGMTATHLQRVPGTVLHAAHVLP